MKGYPRSFRLTLLNTAAALFLTGAFLVPTTLAMRLEWNVIWRLGVNARIGVAALHVLCAFAAMILFGSLWAIHMRAGWRQHRNHRNGLVLIGLLGVLAITGLGIFYLGDETMTLYTALIHAAVGVVLPISLVYHMVAGRRLARYNHRVQGAKSSRHSRYPRRAQPPTDYSASRS